VSKMLQKNFFRVILRTPTKQSRELGEGGKEREEGRRGEGGGGGREGRKGGEGKFRTPLFEAKLRPCCKLVLLQNK
jgi:hypothetical protein